MNTTHNDHGVHKIAHATQFNVSQQHALCKYDIRRWVCVHNYCCPLRPPPVLCVRTRNTWLALSLSMESSGESTGVCRVNLLSNCDTSVSSFCKPATQNNTSALNPCNEKFVHYTCTCICWRKSARTTVVLAVTVNYADQCRFEGRLEPLAQDVIPVNVSKEGVWLKHTYTSGHVARIAITFINWKSANQWVYFNQWRKRSSWMYSYTQRLTLIGRESSGPAPRRSFMFFFSSFFSKPRASFVK